MGFEDLARRAFDTAAVRGAQYADIRFENVRSERIEVRNGVVASLADGRDTGYGMRALVDGAWGFAASSDLSEDGIDRCARSCRGHRACERVDGAQPFRRGATSRRTSTAITTPVERDPQDIPLGARVALLLEAEKLAHASDRIAVARAWLDLWRTEKFFYSTIGSAIEQTILQTGSGVQAMAVGDGDVQTRTYPGDVGLYKGGGWEIVEEAALTENAQRIGEEATALLTAPQCPSGTFDIVLGGSQVSLQIHESCGHPAELDRVMGWEANFSGTSFLEVDQLDKLATARRWSRSSSTIPCRLAWRPARMTTRAQSRAHPISCATASCGVTR